MDDLLSILRQFNMLSAIDIALVTLIFYGVLRLFAGTQGVQLLRGVLVIVLIAVLAGSFSGLTAFSWLLRNSGLAILVAIPVIFQPELRRALERLGRTGMLFGRGSNRSTTTSRLISELVSACTQLSKQMNGAIMVIEDKTGLQEHIEAGVRLEALVSSELLLTIFYPGSALHDGAVIIRNERVEAASCILPLSQRTLPDTTLGTRHRAGIGITEESDALALIVSEENGAISAARNGRLVRHLDEKRLRRVLESFYEPQRQETVCRAWQSGRGGQRMKRPLPLLGSLDRLGTLLLAFILAIIVWAVSVQQVDPFEIRTLSDVSVDVRNLPASLALVDNPSSFPTINIRVRARRSVWDTLTSRDVQVYVDLSQTQTGRQEIPITVDPSLPGAEVVSTDPSALVVRLENRVEKQVPVVVKTLDSPPFGFLAGTAVVTPTHILVSGAKTQVESAQRAELPVRLLDARSAVQVSDSVTLRDRAGSVVAGLMMEPRVVSATVPIEQRQGFSDKSVRVRWTGQPAANHRITGVTVNPAIVTVFGDPDALAEMPAFIETAPINIEGATDDTEERLLLEVPLAVSVVGEQTVDVKVGIEPIEGSLTMSLAPVVQGLGANLQVESISPESLDVIFSGPLPRLEGLSDANVRAVLELANLSAGVHTLTPTLVAPEGITPETILPDTVQVTIVEGQRSGPTVTPTRRLPTPARVPTTLPQP